MAKSNSNNSKKSAAAAAAARKTPTKPVARTETRNSPVPKAVAPVAKPQVKPSISSAAAPRPGSAPRAVSHDEIARRAYEIWQSGQGGSDYDNWVRAERELRGGR
jgi:hypothetical protein